LGDSISTLTVGVECGVHSCDGGDTVILEIKNLRNRFLSGPVVGDITLQSLSSAGYSMDASIVAFSESDLPPNLNANSAAQVVSIERGTLYTGSPTELTVKLLTATRMAKNSLVDLWVPLDAFSFKNNPVCFDGSDNQLSCEV